MKYICCGYGRIPPGGALGRILANEKGGEGHKRCWAPTVSWQTRPEHAFARYNVDKPLMNVTPQAIRGKFRWARWNFLTWLGAFFTAERAAKRGVLPRRHEDTRGMAMQVIAHHTFCHVCVSSLSAAPARQSRWRHSRLARLPSHKSSF